jgi:riboflavin synthase
MFTGIIETTGQIVKISPEILEIGARFGGEPLALGESIAVNGVCLTVSRVTAPGFETQVSQETLARTTIGARSAGERLNLERALMPHTRLGGHIVTGHVDTVVELIARAPETNSERWTFSLPAAIAPYVAFKGSVTLDGISLTVAGIGATSFEVALIPHTLAVTNLGDRKIGDRLNIEVDILARYVESIIASRVSG